VNRDAGRRLPFKFCAQGGHIPLHFVFFLNIRIYTLSTAYFRTTSLNRPSTSLWTHVIQEAKLLLRQPIVLRWKFWAWEFGQTLIRQLEVDVGLAADAAWDMASDDDVQRPVAGQAVW